MEEETQRGFDEVNERLAEVQSAGHLLLLPDQSGDPLRQQRWSTPAWALAGALVAVTAGGITVGQLSAFLSYANQYTKPFNEISGVVTELQNALACAARVLGPDRRAGRDAGRAGRGRAYGCGRARVICGTCSFSYTPDRQLIRRT